MSGTELLAEWRAHLVHDRRRSPHTVRAYGAAAARLVEATGASDWPRLARLDTADLRSHLAARRGEGIGNASAARELSALKALLGFARERAGLPSDAGPRLRGPRVKKGIPRPVSPDDAVNLADLVEADAEQPWIGARDRAVLLLLYGAGLRIAEALALTADALPLGETLRVTGKGGKTRVAPLLPVVREAVADYARRQPFVLERGTPLFRGAKGGPLAQGMVQKAVARARTALG
ncbi:MAG: site-specific integrase, partial [Novosphingobium sp.]|nr:site-specific integrase [Novosphingobium sp.]